jgi:hypothetical protein
MSIPTSCVITNRDKLAQDVWKGNLLLAKAGTVITREIKTGLLRFGITSVKIA